MNDFSILGTYVLSVLTFCRCLRFLVAYVIYVTCVIYVIYVTNVTYVLSMIPIYNICLVLFTPVFCAVRSPRLDSSVG